MILLTVKGGQGESATLRKTSRQKSDSLKQKNKVESQTWWPIPLILLSTKGLETEEESGIEGQSQLHRMFGVNFSLLRQFFIIFHLLLCVYYSVCVRGQRTN